MHICRSYIINVDTKFHGKIDHTPSVFLCSSHMIKFIIFLSTKIISDLSFCVAHIWSSFSTKTLCQQCPRRKEYIFSLIWNFTVVFWKWGVCTHKKRQCLSLPLFPNALPTSLGHWRVCLTTYYDILTPYTPTIVFLYKYCETNGAETTN